jgi:transposase
VKAQVLPKVVESKIFSLRDRVRDIKKKYGSLARYGLPVFESKEEVYALVVANKEFGISANELSKMLGMDKTSVYKWLKRVERGETIAIFNKETKTVESITITIEEAKRWFEEELRPKARKWIKDVMEAHCIQEFVKKPEKIQRSGKHALHYTRTQILRTLKAFQAVIEYIHANKDKIAQVVGEEVPANPDLWDNEDAIYQVIRMMCAERAGGDGLAQRACERDTMMLIRRVPKFRGWFRGRIGSVRQVIRPKEATIFYEHYLRLKQYALSSYEKKEKGWRGWMAFWLIAGLHIEAGSREGWGSLRNMIERMIADGVNVGVKPEDAEKLDLDHPLVSSSLIGIKWDKAVWSPSGELLGFRVYEEKTKKEWELRYPWLDRDLHVWWKKIYEEYAKHKGINSVVKSILMYFDVKPSNGKWTVGAFKTWYRRMVKRLSEMLQLPWELTPHRLRSAHISIMAELRIPMELALSESGFGVGWDDLTTAKIFYLRFSQTLIGDYLKQAEEVKKRISERLRP